LGRGLFLVFEGVDGAGKSSQLARLAERIEALGRRVVRLAEPTHGPEGEEIRRRAREGPPLAPSEELELFLADRRRNVFESVRPALDRGDVVLQDRYLYSTAAYQSARPELGLTPRQVLELHAEWAPRPDLVLLLDLPVEQGLARAAGRGARDAFEERALQEAVRRNFLALAEEEANFRRIDAEPDPDLVAAEVWMAVAPLLEVTG
jgi:dTMP kinase